MNVSIVLRVKNEGRTLGRVLAGVKRQRFKGDIELIVVDSGSTDNTLEIARAHNCRIFHIKPEDFSWGYSLNYGAEKSSGEFIVYVSGHCVPVNDRWLDTLLAPFEDARVGGVYSRHIPLPEIDPFEAIELEYFWFPPGKNKPVESDSFSNASCAIRRETLEAVRFDETLLLCEDGEWAMRARKAGWKIMYQPRSQVYHSHPPKLETIYLRWFWRCYSAKSFNPHTRDGNLLYLFYKTLLYCLLDLKYLWQVKMLSKFWKIPFYEIVRQTAAYRGGRAALAGKKYHKWNDVRVPYHLECLRSIIEK